MRRCITLITLSLWAAAAAPAQTAGQVTSLKAAMAAAAQDDWALAGLSAVAGGTLVREFTAWQRLRDGEGTFDDYRAFLTRSGDWPGLARLRREGEPTLRGVAPELVLDYFGDRVPETGPGIMALIEAHTALGNDGDAQALIVLAWRSHPLDAEAEAELLERYPAILGAHHEARLDAMLWQFESAAAHRMFPLVSEDQQKLAEARLALRAQASGVDDLIKAIPATLQSDPGLVYERFNWRARKGLNDRAIELLAQQSVSGEALGQPERWANWRRIYARMQLREGAVEQAYLLASTHFLTEGSSYADLEWLSGFIALRFLQDPELALFHFQNFRAAVATPISLGRAGYWQGRAHAAAGNAEAAQKAYEFGAQYQTSFYGLLAAEEAGVPLDPALAGTETFPDWDSLPQSQGRVFQMGKLLLEAGELNFAEWFLTHLTESLTRQEAGSLGAWAIARGEPHLALMIAKRAARRGITLPAAYYPLHPMAENIWPVPTELALSIARRESEFDPVVVSPAGALGLMQLMPGTAKQVAEELGVEFAQSRLTSDPAYNAQLGTSYLEDLTEIFGTSPILISVGYNAGPSRAVRWSENRGDPRDAGIDLIDWIELIPFRETRNYVMRVTESLPVYRARLSGKTEPLTFLKELRSGK